MKEKKGGCYLVDTAFLCQSAAAAPLEHPQKLGPARRGQESSARTICSQDPEKTRLVLVNQPILNEYSGAIEYTSSWK